VRIGVDVSCWQNPRGFGRFTRELVRQLVADGPPAHEFVLVADAQTAAAAEFPPGAEVVVAGTRRQPMRAASADGWRSPVDLIALGLRAARCRADVFWFPTAYSYYPVPGRVPVVVTVHDTMTEKQPHLFFPGPRARLFWRLKLWLARRQAAVVTAPSESARRDVAAAFGWPVELIPRIHEAPADVFRHPARADVVATLRARHRLPPDAGLVLYVGAISPHKNLHGLLRALAAMPPRPGAGWHLVIVGDYTTDSALGCHGAVAALRRDLGLEDRVTFTGFVGDDDLRAFFEAARLLVLPSFDEGFGLPVIEAMACGLPVAVSDRGALPELAGDAGLTFDPHDDDAIGAAVARLLDDESLRQELGARGRARAAGFSWQAAARDMMAVFAGVAR
jgi:alpha-1,3-rhamnosyl/mannosyltransferase